MRRALEARAVVAQVAEQKEAGRAAVAASQVCLLLWCYIVVFTMLASRDFGSS